MNSQPRSYRVVARASICEGPVVVAKGQTEERAHSKAVVDWEGMGSKGCDSTDALVFFTALGAGTANGLFTKSMFQLTAVGNTGEEELFKPKLLNTLLMFFGMSLSLIAHKFFSTAKESLPPNQLILLCVPAFASRPLGNDISLRTDSITLLSCRPSSTSAPLPLALWRCCCCPSRCGSSCVAASSYGSLW